jgi:catechol 2,3-dioxygenase-like lactoylglutathione lyase family enzyme
VKVRGVLETSLYAGELAAAAAFYESVLGLERIGAAAGRHVFLRCGASVVLLFDPARTEVAGGEVPPHGARGPGHVAFAVEAAELPAWRRRLEEAGVAIEAEVAWPRGGRSLYVRDPAGNSIELTSPSIWGLAAGE